jgi:GDP-L-fucose synthase
MSFTWANRNVYVAGHSGLVGSALVRKLTSMGVQPTMRPRAQLDLTRADDVRSFFASERPDIVFMAAGTVGGILANDTYPGDFIRDNLAMQSNILEAAREYAAAKLLFFGSACAYPKLAPQPIEESRLLTGPLEPTNSAYAVAKIAGLEMCRAYWRQYGCRFISAMPTNLYGPRDNFDLQTSHVLPALLRKFHEAKLSSADSVTLWGSGRPRREFLHVDDFADACVLLMERWESPDPVNVGVGEDVSIAELATLVQRVVDFRGKVVYDASKPDGVPRRRLDVSRLTALGWKPRIGLEDGVRATYAWFLRHGAEADRRPRPGGV